MTIEEGGGRARSMSRRFRRRYVVCSQVVDARALRFPKSLRRKRVSTLLEGLADEV